MASAELPCLFESCVELGLGFGLQVVPAPRLVRTLPPCISPLSPYPWEMTQPLLAARPFRRAWP